MAESVPIYVEELLRRQLAVGRDKLGVNITASGRTPYAVNLLQLTIIGAFMKTLVDKGVITDAELLFALDHALDGTWPDWVIEQQPPPT